MRKGNLRKVTALALAGALLLSPLPVRAAEVDSEDAAQGSTSGSGNVEGIVNKDVFKVELPTVPDTNDTTFNFILDPQGLIKDTNGTAHTNATFDADAKGLYFANPQDGGATKYQASSPSLTATNKGTLDVDVTLTAVASDLTDTNNAYTIGLSKDDIFSGDKTTTIYLALVSGDQTVALDARGAKITDMLKAAPADAYEVTYDTTESKYKYGLTTAAQAASYTGFDSLDFNLTGACNTAADWASTEDAAPSVNVTWTLERHYVVPESDTSTPITINYKGADPAAGSLTFTKPDGSNWTPGAAVYNAGSISIKPANKAVVLTTDWLKSAKTAFGYGTYSVNINGKDYAFVIEHPAPVTDTTVPITFNYNGDAPAAGTLTFTKPDGSTWTPPETIYTSGNITIDSATQTVTLSENWLPVVKTNFGNGTYSVNINGKDYAFVIADQLPPPSTDTTVPIMFRYTGEDPAAGTLTFTKPDGSTWTPPEAIYTSGNITIDTVTKMVILTTDWLPVVKTNFGTGTYSVAINEANYEFVIE